MNQQYYFYMNHYKPQQEGIYFSFAQLYILLRASIRYDTMAIMGVSLNTLDKQTAVVWQIGNLPMDGYLYVFFDCTYVLSHF